MDDPLIVLDRRQTTTTSLRDMLCGGSAFLVGGGPSTKAFDTSLLNKRGIWSIGVNNVAGHIRTNAFVCSDPPAKFHNGIWQDPSVMKLIPTAKFSGGRRNILREKVGNEFIVLERQGKKIHTIDCPNTWGFARRAWWSYNDDFFTEDSATWGNNEKGAIQTGNPKTMCTMLLAIRLLHHLGARTIYLVGVDFNMTEEGYSFGQGRTSQAVSNNNTQYTVVNRGLCEMVERGIFQKFGLNIFNCYQNSGLRAFPYVPFETAIKLALSKFPEEPLDLTGWYEKNKEDEKVQAIQEAME